MRSDVVQKINNAKPIRNGPTTILDSANKFVVKDIDLRSVDPSVINDNLRDRLFTSAIDKNIWISTDVTANGTSATNLTLSDNINWNTVYAYITSIKVVTVSVSWDLWLCETSDFDVNLVSSRQIAAARNGNYDITLEREYNPSDKKVYLVVKDNTPGGSSFRFYIVGQNRGH